MKLQPEPFRGCLFFGHATGKCPVLSHPSKDCGSEARVWNREFEHSFFSVWNLNSHSWRPLLPVGPFRLGAGRLLLPESCVSWMHWRNW